VLLGHPVSPGRQGNGTVIGKRRERHKGIVPQVKPLLSPPLHQYGHVDVKIRINAMPEINVNDCASRYCKLCVRVLWMSDMEEIVPHAEMGVNAHVGLTQSHEGRDVEDPRGGQIVQL
jgi:hypothetical protein